MSKKQVRLFLSKSLKLMLLFFGFILLGSIIINLYVRTSVKSRILPIELVHDLNADAIMVLGAAAYPGLRPSPMLAERITRGMDLYDLGVSNRLLMSGDNGTLHYDEVNTMKHYAVNGGIDSSHVFMDHAGFSTYESMYRANAIFDIEKIVIVSQGYHLYRAVYIAEQLGLEAYGVPSQARSYRGQLKRDIREYLAIVKDFFKCIYQPYPTFLGDKIPITGDGNLTND